MMNQEDSKLCDKACSACREVLMSNSGELLKRQAAYWLSKAKTILVEDSRLMPQSRFDFNYVIKSFNKELESQGLLPVT